MSAIREIFIKNLKYYRKKKEMTQLTLSMEMDKGVNYIASIENSQSFPPPETIDQIAEILGIHPSQLFDENGSPENVLENSKDEFAEKVTSELEKRITQAIRREIREVLEK